MAEPDRPLFADAKHQVARLGAELRRMAGLRWQLARLETEEAFRSARRLAVVLAIVAIMALTALPILVVWGAEFLGEVTRFPRAGWLLCFALTLLTTGALGGWLAWRRFRRQFVGLEETLEELREDLVWLQEWTGRDEDTRAREPGDEELRAGK